MCRIAGLWNLNRSESLQEICSSMLDTLARGGPDDYGIFIDKNSNIALGHRRLAIIDLSPSGHQPMSTADQRYTLTYNGEIYNYIEIRDKLISKGVSFEGNSDTEVVLQAFAQWGIECLKQFIGMFAFAIWDSLEKSLYIVRDRLGVKPLYYYHKNQIFAFASELKALHAFLYPNLEINLAALGEFFHYGYIAAPNSIYKHIYKVRPGHYLKVTSDLDVESYEYWSPINPYPLPILRASEENITDTMEELMIDAFTKRLIADVPVGIFLSGGIDSSLVTAILAKHSKHNIKTFTIGFKEKNFDESSWAKKVACHLGTEHTEKIITQKDAQEIIDLWPQIYDEPFGDISGIPTTILARMTRNKVKVSLSADGGDELFCGYKIYNNTQKLAKYLQFFSPKLMKYFGSNFLKLTKSPNLHSLISGINPNIVDRITKSIAICHNWNGNINDVYSQAVSYWQPEEIKELTDLSNYDTRLSPIGQNIITAMMQWDLKHYLPDDILVKVDRATMYWALEGREPMLDHRIVEFAMQMPLALKKKNNTPKYILKKILKRYLPDKLFDRPKQGFAVPIHKWLMQDLNNQIDKYLSPNRISNQCYLNPKIVKNSIDNFKHRQSTLSAQKVWLLIVFMMWYETYS